MLFIIDKIKIKYKEFTLGFNCFVFMLVLLLIWFVFFYKVTPNISNFNWSLLSVMNKKVEIRTKNNNFMVENKENNWIALITLKIGEYVIYR